MTDADSYDGMLAADFDLRGAFRSKQEKLATREARLINGRIRISGFRDN